MIFNSTDFKFDNKESKDFNIILVSMESTRTGIFGIQQSAEEEQVGNRDIPYFYGTKLSTPTFNLVFAMADKYYRPQPFTQEEREKVVKWLCKREYKPFISYDNLGIVYYMLFTQIDRSSFVNDTGYLTLSCKLNAPYGFTNLMNNPITNYNTTKQFIIENKSNVVDEIRPIIEIELLEDSKNVKIKNLTLGQEMSFTNLDLREKLTVYNDLGFIKSSTGKYRFNNFNRQWITLIYGVNHMEIEGKCKVNFVYNCPIAL